MSILTKVAVNPNGRIWGYVRGSTEKQYHGPARQGSMIEELDREVKKELEGIEREIADRQQTRQGRPAAVVVEAGRDACSAERVAWCNRPHFKTLMQQMQPGDTLVVWRLSRIDRWPLRALQAVQWLMDHHINLVMLSEMGGLMKVDLSTSTGVMQILWMAQMLEMERNARSLNAKEMHAYRKAHGLAGSGHWCPFGKRKYVEYLAEFPQDYSRARKYWVWDEEECQVLARIIEWVRGGESFRAVARRLQAEGVHRTGYKRGVKVKVSWQAWTVQEAYWRMERYLETHESLGPVAVPKAAKKYAPQSKSHYVRAEKLEVGGRYLLSMRPGSCPHHPERVTIVKIYPPSVFWPKGAYRHVNANGRSRVCSDPTRYYIAVSGPAKEWTDGSTSSAAPCAVPL
jgi:DNA invertase Pin-like site-specific DNA recombinase